MCVMQPRPITDSYDDLDTAAWIASHGAVDVDNYHIKYMGAFSNNYTLTLIFAVILKVLPFLQMSGILMVLTLMNAVAILVAIFLMWLILKECVGIRAANKALILCTFNPIYYCLVFWIYSLTFSLPFMMGIVYVAIRIYKCIDIKKEVLLEIFLGILIVVGYELRPTNVFPVIAMVLALPLVLSKHHVLKKNFEIRYSCADCSSGFVCYRFHGQRSLFWRDSRSKLSNFILDIDGIAWKW